MSGNNIETVEDMLPGVPVSLFQETPTDEEAAVTTTFVPKAVPPPVSIKVRLRYLLR